MEELEAQIAAAQENPQALAALLRNMAISSENGSGKSKSGKSKFGKGFGGYTPFLPRQLDGECRLFCFSDGVPSESQAASCLGG